MPHAAPTWAITWNDGTVEAQLTTCLICEAVAAFAVPFDELPGDTEISTVFTDAVHQVLPENLNGLFC